MTTCDSDNYQFINKDCFLVLLATGERNYIGEDIQRMFQLWINLNSVGRQRWSSCMEDVLNGGKICLYQQLIQAFEIWNNIQRRRGAPGWSGEIPSGAEMETEISNLIHAMELVWRIHMTSYSSKNDDTMYNRDCFFNESLPRHSPQLNATEFGGSRDSDIEKQISPLESDDELP